MPSEAISTLGDLGISRSPTIVIVYLMRKYGIKREKLFAFVQSKQKIKSSANFTRQLQVWEDQERTVAKGPYQAFPNGRAQRRDSLKMSPSHPGIFNAHDSSFVIGLRCPVPIVSWLKKIEWQSRYLGSLVVLIT